MSDSDDEDKEQLKKQKITSENQQSDNINLITFENQQSDNITI